ncbi:rRNA N6-adenosine-methyltransferase METTL5 [Bradysia coprophila]|uniref:rRNA N6-adenosine-methyltransferase METTL5 n=1 Tax=Bradysia coprophila TaxID=38358 RepID=UPI00187D9DA3|nr:rRNA N6-adenosine-methyltransferase METTL5 [Bradysia coprophila]XP_037028922.1 rRNA N6-adenosine-methyltransferase METTL5 [Bradysia coprophila]
MKLKKLEEYLQGVDGFEKPKLLLEQYITPSHIASNMLFTIQSKYGDLEGKTVADLGCGCGMLSIGAFLLGSQYTVGFDIDRDALNILQRNINEMEIPGVDGVQLDVIQDLKESKWKGVFDTVLMNPPFGTKHNAGMDIKFLETGIALATGTVYSLHKTSTRQFIKRKSEEWGVPAEIIAELRYNIDASYKFHKKASVDIEVDCWRFNVVDKDMNALT